MFLSLLAGEGAHPFTLVNADQGDGTLRFAIKALGDSPRGNLPLQVAVGQRVGGGAGMVVSTSAGR